VPRHFGSFRGALIAASVRQEGSTITRDGKQYTNQELITAFLDRCIDTEEVLTYRAAMQAGKEGLIPRISAYLNAFDSWNDVILAAGLKPNLIRYTPAEEELIEELQTYIRNHDRVVPTYRQLQESHTLRETRFSTHDYIKVFGTWNDALITAGLEPNLVRGKEREQVLKNLIEYLESKKRVPTTREYDEDSKQGCAFDSRGTLVRIFGRWSSAVNKAIILGELFGDR